MTLPLHNDLGRINFFYILEESLRIILYDVLS